MLILSFAGCYLLLCVLGYVAQRKLLFVPTKIPADVVVQAAVEHGFVPWKNAAGEIIGWRTPATNQPVASVLIMHGNGGCAIMRDYIAQPIRAAAAVDVFVLEYPGYGARAGSPSRATLNAAGEEAFQLLPKNLPRYLVSESLGTGVACDLAQAHPNEIAGMVLFVPYHNLAYVAQRKMWFLPAYFFLWDRYNPEESLKGYRGPVKFVIAAKDEVIPPVSGRRLADSYQGRKDVEVFASANHNDVSEEPPEWWRGVFTFWAAERHQ